MKDEMREKEVGKKTKRNGVKCERKGTEVD